MNYINKKSEDITIVVCPYCNGLGYETVSKRISWDETDYNRVQCYLCKGKRVVRRKITTEYLEVEDSQ